MSRLLRAGVWLLLACAASPALAQDVIVFTSNRAHPGSQGWETSIFRMNLDGSDLRDLTPGWPSVPQPEWAPAISPDRQWIAFVAEGSLWKMRLDGSDRTFITDNAMIHTNAWSADGSHIYFSTPGTCAEDVDVVAVDGSGRRRAVDAGVDFPENVAARVSVSVNDEIAVIGGNCGPGPRHLYVKRLGETPARLLVPYTNLASWSPDGEQLVLSRCFPGEACQLWTADREGNNLTQLTFPGMGDPNGSVYVDPSWSPDASKILFTRYDYLVYPTEYRSGNLYVMDPVPWAAPEQITFGDKLFDVYAVWVRLNTPPVADAGPDKVLECAGVAGTPVTLDGSASSDADGDSLTYIWTGPFPEGGGRVTGVSPVATLPFGRSTITLVVNDGQADSIPSTFVVNVSVSVLGFEPPLGPLVPEGSTVQIPKKAFNQGRMLPLRLQTLCSGGAVCGETVVAPRIVELKRSGDALDIETLDLDAGHANDSGVDFRPVDGHWVFNLSSGSLLPGTYTITVEMMDKSRWVGGFVLK